jgi:hypothetical protein
MTKNNSNSNNIKVNKGKPYIGNSYSMQQAKENCSHCICISGMIIFLSLVASCLLSVFKRKKLFAKWALEFQIGFRNVQKMTQILRALINFEINPLMRVFPSLTGVHRGPGGDGSPPISPLIRHSMKSGNWRQEAVLCGGEATRNWLAPLTRTATGPGSTTTRGSEL